MTLRFAFVECAAKSCSIFSFHASKPDVVLENFSGVVIYELKLVALWGQWRIIAINTKMATNPHYLTSFALVFCAGCMLGIGCAVQFPHLARRLLGKFCVKTEGLAILGELRETAKARHDLALQG